MVRFPQLNVVMKKRRRGEKISGREITLLNKATMRLCL
jgi:hypothetical protein